jgi:voltage-gated potassium channel
MKARRRMLELVQSGRFGRAIFSMRGASVAGILVVVVVIVGGVLFSVLENHANVWDGIYWAGTTITTVGYGDIVPHSHLGRILAFAVEFAGIGFVAVLTAALAERFVAHGAARRAEEDLLSAIEHEEEDLLRELKHVMERLQNLEKMVRQLRAKGAG